MEDFFWYADYSIALDYVEVLAEDKGIKTRFGRRTFGENTETLTEPASVSTNLTRLGFWTRVRNSIKQNGLKGFLRNVMIKIKNL